MGRETAMADMAHAFRSIPVGRYARCHGNGCDRNVWIATGAWEDEVYGYVANPFWWTTQARLTFAEGTEVDDLMRDRAVAGGHWQLELPPYAVRTFHGRGVAPEHLVAGCRAEASARGREWVSGLVRAAQQTLEGNRDALENAGGVDRLTAMVGQASEVLAGGDVGGAHELLYAYPYRSALMRIDGERFAPGITDGGRE
jgi:hypothetical protein